MPHLVLTDLCLTLYIANQLRTSGFTARAVYTWLAMDIHTNSG